MKFDLPEPSADLVKDLLDIEQTRGQLSAESKAKIVQAAQRIEVLERACWSVAAQLDEAANVRAGLMDSEQRQQEVQNHIRKTMTSAATQLRGA